MALDKQLPPLKRWRAGIRQLDRAAPCSLVLAGHLRAGDVQRAVIVLSVRCCRRLLAARILAPMDEPRPSRHAVKPRSDRYCLSEKEQRDYTAFVEMLSQLEKGARLQLAEEAIKEAAQLSSSEAAVAASVQPRRPQ